MNSACFHIDKQIVQQIFPMPIFFMEVYTCVHDRVSGNIQWTKYDCVKESYNNIQVSTKTFGWIFCQTDICLSGISKYLKSSFVSAFTSYTSGSY